MKVRKRPITVEAILFDGKNWDEVGRFIAKRGFQCDRDGDAVLVHTLEGSMKAKPGHYVLAGIHDEVYPVAPQIFDETYEVVEP